MSWITTRNGTRIRSNSNAPDFDVDMGAGIGPFKFGDTPEAREHDLGSLMCSTEECHRLNDENFLKNLWFKFKKKRTIGHLWETGQGYAVKLIASIYPFWHHKHSRLKEWLDWSRLK